MDIQKTYSIIRQSQSGLGYELGLIETPEQTSISPIQKQLYLEAKQRIGKERFNAISFSGDVPIAYFKLLSDYNADDIRETHKLIWNQSRVPSLYVVTPAELRIYNCYESPLKPNENIEKRLVQRIKIAEEKLNQYHEFAKVQFDSGEFWKTAYGRRYQTDKRVEIYLLTQLRETRTVLHNKYRIPYPIIHDLLGRAIFILYLEDRGAIRQGYYSEQFLNGANSFVDVLQDKEATYHLFDTLAERFNGDLLPVTTDERQKINETHLAIVRNLFAGGDVSTGQMSLWRPYNFRAIPIELISVIYEEFLHKEQGKRKTKNDGVHYTAHPLVEFIMNEVLPWPSSQDHKYDIRVLDPACGSGIFLVEAYRRLIARWLYSHGTDKIEPAQLKELLTSKIFGIDINADAVRVTAFSLYLALLDHLSPRTIWENLQFPHLIYHDPHSVNNGNNLFPLDTFSEKAPFEKRDYDLVVGNPPWKRSNLPTQIAMYCREHGLAQEMAQAFAWRARDFCKEGKIALIINSKTLFNNGDGDKNFRQKLLSECYLQAVVNFSALRKKRGGLGKQLFAAAVGPASVLFYRASLPDDAKNEVLYCTPKPTRVDNALPYIIIDASEIQYIPRDQFIESDWTWKTGMWGTQRDHLLIHKFREFLPLREYIVEESGWNSGVGLESPGEGTVRNKELENLPLIKTGSLLRYWGKPIEYEIKQLGDITYRRIGAKKTYKSPHILIKEGQKNKRFCASYLDFSCAFRKAVFGISADKSKETLLKALVAYLNSSLASYFLFLTAASWGVERERVNFHEVLELPGIPFIMEETVVNFLASKVEAIGKILQKEDYRSDEIDKLELEIDKIIFDYLDLSTDERFLIQDILNYSLDFFQEGEVSQACAPVFGGQLKAYAQTACKTLNKLLRFGNTTVWATVYEGQAPLNIVTLNFNQTCPANTVRVVQVNIDAELVRINDRLREEQSENIYLRRHLKLYGHDTIDIVKPNEQRFWSQSLALKDADSILAEGVIRGNLDVKQVA